MQSICKQPEDFYQDFYEDGFTLKIDFYFEVFKQTEKLCFELSHRSNIA